LCPEQIRTCHKEVLMFRPRLTSQFLHFYVCQYVVRSGEICGAILYHVRSWCQCWSVCVCVTCVLASCIGQVLDQTQDWWFHSLVVAFVTVGGVLVSEVHMK
jgi:hypothetical protein